METPAVAAPLSESLIEDLAIAVHEVFCTAMRERGFVYAPTTSEPLRTHNALRPFAELAEDEREQNRLLARAIPEKLHLAGFTIVNADPHTISTEFPGELLERLAEDEHARWVRSKLAAGWRYAPVTDKPNKRHASLIPWLSGAIPSPGGTYSAEELALMGTGDLSEEEREKDRVMIRGIPQILAQAGLAVRPVSPAVDTEPRINRSAKRGDTP